MTTGASEEPTPVAPGTEEIRGRRVLLGTIAVYVISLGVLVATGRIAFLPKEILIPLIFLPPAISGQFGVFWADWGRLLGLIVLFDALRGLIYACITAFGLPVYMGYAIAGERALLGGATGPERLQGWLYSGVGWFEQLLTLVHASHFAVIFVFGLLVWHWRRAAFARFQHGLTLVLYVGLLGYALVPTVPPWMADRFFGVIPPLARPIMEAYSAAIPNIVTQFDTNPIAAMPSLHCAIPTLIAVAGARAFGFKSWPLFVYTGLVWFSVVYGGEHYVVDVIAGVALALGVDAFSGWRERERVRPLAGDAQADTGEVIEAGSAVAESAEDPTERQARATVSFGVLLALSAVIAMVNIEVQGEWIPTESFNSRELVGQSPVAPYYQASAAFARGDTGPALVHLDALPPSHRFDRATRLRVEILLARDDPQEALRTLERARPSRIDASEHLYWQVIAEARAGSLTEARWNTALEQLMRDPEHGGPAWAMRLIEAQQAGFVW